MLLALVNFLNFIIEVKKGIFHHSQSIFQSKNLSYNRNQICAKFMDNVMSFQKYNCKTLKKPSNLLNNMLFFTLKSQQKNHVFAREVARIFPLLPLLIILFLCSKPQVSNLWFLLLCLKCFDLLGCKFLKQTWRICNL